MGLFPRVLCIVALSFGEKERKRNRYYSIPMATTTSWLATRTSAFVAPSSRATKCIGIDPQRGKCCSFQRIAREKHLSRERQVCPERRRQAKGHPPLDRVVQRQ